MTREEQLLKLFKEVREAAEKIDDANEEAAMQLICNNVVKAFDILNGK